MNISATSRPIAIKFYLKHHWAVFDLIFFILAGNEDMNESSKEFEDWPDRTTEGRVRCP